MVIVAVAVGVELVVEVTEIVLVGVIVAVVVIGVQSVFTSPVTEFAHVDPAPIQVPHPPSPQ